MRVYLGSDHAGFHLKTAVRAYLESRSYEIVDCGAHTYDPADDYPPFCIDTAQRVIADPGSLGVVIGGSGNGEQITANKVAGVRCALAHSLETAKLARQHNNANLVGIGARMHSEREAVQIVEAFVSTPFSNDPRHIRRIEMVSNYERSGSRSD